MRMLYQNLLMLLLMLMLVSGKAAFTPKLLYLLFSCQVAFPTIKVEYVDLKRMVERHRGEVDQMKALFGQHYPEGTVFKVAIVLNRFSYQTALAVLYLQLGVNDL